MKSYPPVLKRLFLENNKIMVENVKVESEEHYLRLIEENKRLRESLTFDFSFIDSPEFKQKDYEFMKNYMNKMKGD